MKESNEEDVTLVPTSSMSFEKQVRILRAYVVLSERGSKPIHYREVVSATRLARTQVSGVNSFFEGLGLIRKAAKGTYVPAEELVKFYSDVPGDEDYNYLRNLIDGSELHGRVRSFIQIHGSATEGELFDYLLDISGETTRSRASRALEWLTRTGLIRTCEDGTVQTL